MSAVTAVPPGNAQCITTYKVLDRAGMIRNQGLPNEDAARKVVERLTGDAIMNASGAPFTILRVIVTMHRDETPIAVIGERPETA